MEKSFDDLFNEFFDSKFRKERNLSIKNINLEDAKKFIEGLFKDPLNSISGENLTSIESSLGKPDSIEFYNEGNLFFEKRTWKTPNGDIVKTLISDDPTLIGPPVIEKTLNEKLAEAVEGEDFEKAALIRDEINKRKDNTK